MQKKEEHEKQAEKGKKSWQEGAQSQHLRKSPQEDIGERKAKHSGRHRQSANRAKKKESHINRQSFSEHIAGDHEKRKGEATPLRQKENCRHKEYKEAQKKRLRDKQKAMQFTRMQSGKRGEGASEKSSMNSN